MKLNFQFGKLLENPRNTKIISVILAAVIWLILVGALGEDQERIIRNVPISIRTEGTLVESYGLAVIGDTEYTVDITVTGKRSVLGGLSAEDFNVYANPPTVTGAGEYNFTVTVEKQDPNNSEFTIKNTSVSVINVLLDELKSDTFTISAKAPNVSTEEGYALGDIFAENDTVTIEGPEEEISQISTVTLETDQKIILTKTEKILGTIVYYNEQGEKLDLPNTSAGTFNLDITVTVLKLKAVPLSFKYANVPDGISTDELEPVITPSEVTIAAPEDVADNLLELSLGIIDFRHIDIGSEVTFDSISVPAGGVKIYSGETSAKVTFPKDGFSSTTLSIDQANISVINLPTNYDVSVTSDKITNVKIVGLEEIVEDITSEDVVAVYDWRDKSLQTGTVSVKVKITIPDKGLVWAVGEYSVVLSVTERE